MNYDFFMDKRLKNYINDKLQSSGVGMITVPTFSDLETLYPNGSTDPIWVVSENSWYYWKAETKYTNTLPASALDSALIGNGTNYKGVFFTVKDTKGIVSAGFDQGNGDLIDYWLWETDYTPGQSAAPKLTTLLSSGKTDGDDEDGYNTFTLDSPIELNPLKGYAVVYLCSSGPYSYVTTTSTTLGQDDDLITSNYGWLFNMNTQPNVGTSLQTIGVYDIKIGLRNI